VLGRSRSSAPVDVVLRCTWLQHFWNSLLFNSKGDVFKRVVVMSASACRHEKMQIVNCLQALQMQRSQSCEAEAVSDAYYALMPKTYICHCHQHLEKEQGLL
jgi:hypothetical protein